MAAESGEPPGTQSHIRWVAEAHRNLRELLFRLNYERPPDLAYFDMEQPDRKLLQLSSAVFDYYDQIAPMRHHIRELSRERVAIADAETDLWTQTVYTAEIPKKRKLSGAAGRQQSSRLDHMRKMEQEHSQLRSEDSFRQPETEEEQIKLSTLRKWEGWVRRHDHERTISQVGRVVDKRQYRIVIPVVGARRVYQQLNDCLEELNLLSPVREAAEEAAGEYSDIVEVNNG